jgi:AcrR family transcriptional regulator
VGTAIEIIHSEGLEKATMRRLAHELDTGQSSLYVYVANIAELHAAVLDQLISSISVGRGAWGKRLRRLLDGYADVLYAYPGLARSALVLRPTGPNALRLYDRLLEVLIKGGIPVPRAAWGVDLLLLHITAEAAEHSAPTPSDIDSPADDHAEWNALAAAVRGADRNHTPHVAAHAEALLCGTPVQRSSWAIEALVKGIASTATPQEGAST